MDVIAKDIAEGEMITENALCHRTSFSVTGPAEYKKPFYVAREVQGYSAGSGPALGLYLILAVPLSTHFCLSR